MLAKRIRRLELMLVAIVVLAVGVAAYRGTVVTFEQVHCDAVFTKQIQLEDANGTLIGQWGKAPDGSCQFSMSDGSIASGRPKQFMRVIVEKGFLQVILQDANNANGVAISLQDGKPIIMTKEAGQPWTNVN